MTLANDFTDMTLSNDAQKEISSLSPRIYIVADGLPKHTKVKCRIALKHFRDGAKTKTEDL
jgi:hypothetical protein